MAAIRCVICNEWLAASEDDLLDDPNVGAGLITEMFNPEYAHELGRLEGPRSSWTASRRTAWFTSRADKTS
jgi:hypothetical protein